MKTVYAVSWDSHDSWSGPEYNVAHSLHMTPDDASLFFRALRERDTPGRVPSFYYSMSSQPRLVKVTEKIFRKVAASKYGIWAAKTTTETYQA